MEAAEIIETIYFGGGTPSLLSTTELQSLLNNLHAKFTISPATEFTLEANPDDVSTDSLQAWERMGVNRLSLGVQSFYEAELKWMNRAHNASQSVQSIEQINAAGFANFSIDLIYGSPLLSNEDFAKNVERVINLGVPHISAYALTVEPKTALDAFIKSKKSAPVDEVKQAEQFDILLAMAEAAGFEQYEISNFARPGFRSKHNSSYWQGKPYYGFGPSAHSFDGKQTRRWNIANNALYQKSIEKNIVPFEEEVLTPTQQLNEYIMIRLRTAEGIDMHEVSVRFGSEQAHTLANAAAAFLANELIQLKGTHLALTKKGKFLADGIASDLFFE
ncbi:MAG: radical SAM family heme chaperone HemW [Chitinophagaceae bacterium]|nr:MAG: radical SAM family heme chaperone HemW [Chitinophagaceae bacterium]